MKPFQIEGEVVCKHTTNVAILVEMPDGSEEWFPLSQIHDDSEVYQAGDSGTLIVSEWIAKKKGLCEH